MMEGGVNMLEHLKKKNPNLPIFSVEDAVFAPYGRIISSLDVSKIKEAAEKMDMPKEGSIYLVSVESFEQTSAAGQIRDVLYGELPIQVGYCYGHSNFLNAAEWHTSSEINIAVTPLVLILGQITDIHDGKLDSADMKAFYVPAGAVIEVYATTLHFCPCEVESSGFGCVVALPAGTNLPLERSCEDKLLFRKNKWLIAHNDNKALIERGVVPGIFGENFEVLF